MTYHARSLQLILDTMNTSKGIVYVQEYDLASQTVFDEFKSYLQENNNILGVEVASFIKPRSKNTSAVLITFSSKTLPYSLYIPGERQDSKVYPFVNKPMHCSKCQLYGHTTKRCKSEESVCRKCSQKGHSQDTCQLPLVRCFNCGGSHEAGNRSCPRFIDESEILRIHNKEGISIQRARQTYSGITADSNRSFAKKNTIFDITFSKTDKLTFSPKSIEKCLEGTLKGKPKTIRTISDTTYCVELENIEQAQTLRKADTVGNFPVTVTESTRGLNAAKGIVFISEYNMVNFDDYRKELLERLPVTDIVLATWRKSKNPRAKALLLTFKSDNTPLYIDIPGELTYTPVYEQKPRPMICKKCLQYGHTMKHCGSEDTNCSKCSLQGHMEDKCPNSTERCYHCKQSHRTGYRDCRVLKYESEIHSIQLAQRVPRGQAKLVFDKMNPLFLR